MSLIDGHSLEVGKSELDLFTVSPTQTSITSTQYIRYFPTTSLTAGGPVDFNINVGEERYIDLQKTFLYLKCRVLKGSRQAITGDNQDAYVFPVNYPIASMFKSVEVYLENKLVSSTDTMYPYRALYEQLLSYNQAQKSEQMAMGLYFPEEGDLDETTKDADGLKENTSAMKRLTLTKNSIPFELIGRIHNDLFNQPKLIPGKYNMKLKMFRHSANFFLMSRNNQTDIIAIDEAILFLCTKEVVPSVREGHAIGLQTSTIKFPIRRTEMKFFTRSAGSSDISEPNLTSGPIPRRVIFGLVESNAFNGERIKNPFNFKHFNLQNIKLKVNNKLLPYEEIKLDFGNDNFFQGYFTLFNGTNRLFNDSSIGITRDMYANGYALYVFDLSPDQSETDTLSVLNEGTVGLYLSFRAALPRAVVAVVYLEYDSLIEIDKDDIVHYE